MGQERKVTAKCRWAQTLKVCDLRDKGCPVLRSLYCQKHRKGGTFENRQDANRHNLEISKTDMDHSPILVKGDEMTNV